MLFNKATNIPVPGFIFSLLGFAWSIFLTIGIGTDIVCVSSGCELLKEVRIAGISPWWVADGLFFLMALFSFLRLRSLAQVIAAIFLAGDCIFLFIMLFLSPCISCLIVTVLLFCAFITLYAKTPGLCGKARQWATVALSLLWSVLFIMNLGPALNDIAGPKLLYANPESKMKIYFSPTCPACQEAVRAFGETADFYAVAENDEDVVIIADLMRRINKQSLTDKQSLAEALETISALRKAGSYTAPELSFWQVLSLRFDFMRNQARISRLGFNSLPVIMFEGMPRNWLSKHEPAQQEVQPAQQEDKPAQQEDKPAQQEVQPAQQEVEPAQQEVEPAQQEVEPAQQEDTANRQQEQSAPLLPDLTQKPLECGPDHKWSSCP
jgi:thiol-disulfide isomerase/thioredoxin